MATDSISLKGVRTHNLKNFNIELPHNKIIVLTGVSGSGKSSLAFDTLYAEGQRRYVESLSAYARQFLARMEKPDLDQIHGILPAISIEAKNVIQNARSTVGTQTEINDYLRVLYARVGQTLCQTCDQPVSADNPEKVARELIKSAAGKEAQLYFSVPVPKGAKQYIKDVLGELMKQGFIRLRVDGKLIDLSETKVSSIKASHLDVLVDQLIPSHAEKSRLVDSIETAYRYGKGALEALVGRKTRRFSEQFHCAHCDIAYKRLSPNAFSFNSPLGACPECQGFGRVITIDRDLVIPNPNKTLQEGAIEPWTKPSQDWFMGQMLSFCRRKKIPLNTPFAKLSAQHQKLIWEGVAKDEYESVEDFFRYLERKVYKMHVRVLLSRYRGYVLCARCEGRRLKPEPLQVRVANYNISEVQQLTVAELTDFFKKLKLSKAEAEAAGPVLLELRNRAHFLNEVGLGYISLNRLSRTLSGGEAQRINLTAALSANLVDTLYVLDEPSIGLHERDNGLLIQILRRLRDLGNTVIVVEHDRQMIEAADLVIDIGPDAGEQGGEIVFQGPVGQLSKVDSWTAKYLSGRETVASPPQNSTQSANHWLKVRGARRFNLGGLDLDIPLGQFVVLTGVSGSGKSTLLYDVLHGQYQRFRGRPVQDVGGVKSIKGWEAIDDIVIVDQSPIGRTPRSNPITYIKAFDEVRKIFARTEHAKREGFTPGNFSFNVAGGRCDKCEGSGRLKVEMHFLADIYVECEECEGKRFKENILAVRYQDKNIHDVLHMTCDEAHRFFGGYRDLQARLDVLRQVGLGYLQLGQSALTLSQGEAQRIKLALELAGGKKDRVLYLFDEPTTGLHYHDIRYLMTAFRKLIDQGHSVIVIEHNMEVIRFADYILDLGPEGGEGGGQLVFSGTPAELASKPPQTSSTGIFLKKYLKKVRASSVKRVGITADK